MKYNIQKIAGKKAISEEFLYSEPKSFYLYKYYSKQVYFINLGTTILNIFLKRTLSYETFLKNVLKKG